MSLLLYQRPRRRVILGGLTLLVLILTLTLSRNKHGHKSNKRKASAMSVEELPSKRHKYPTGRLTFKNLITPKKPKWDKSRAVKGGPTLHFRDNLQPDQKYVTTWNYGGMTNEIMVWMNLIHLGLVSNRIPILFPIVGLESQVGVGAETLSAGAFFDLPRLSEAIGHPVLTWQDVKKGRYNRPWHWIDRVPHPDDELLGCWSIVQTFDESKKPLQREGGPHVIHLDVQYTAVPPSVKLNGTDSGWHTSFDSLSHLMSPEGRSEALSIQPQLPTWAQRPLPPTTPIPPPDDHLTCFDNLYWVWKERVWEWEQTPSPTWDTVGTHMHWTKEAQEIADIYLRRIFELEDDETIPPFITIHARHGDFKNLCQNPEDPKGCQTPLIEYARLIGELNNELIQIYGSDSPFANVREVIMMSDETDPEWWADVERMGWKRTIEFEEEIARDYGRRWPAIIDSVILSRGTAFVGTSQSTMSLIAARRVMDWNKGPIRMAEFKRAGL